MKDFPLKDPLLSQEQYDQMYAESFANKEQFWSKIANEQVTWFKNLPKLKTPTMREMFQLSGLRMVN